MSLDAEAREAELENALRIEESNRMHWEAEAGRLRRALDHVAGITQPNTPAGSLAREYLRENRIVSHDAELFDAGGVLIGRGVVDDAGSARFEVTVGPSTLGSWRCEALGITGQSDGKSVWPGDIVTIPPPTIA